LRNKNEKSIPSLQDLNRKKLFFHPPSVFDVSSSSSDGEGDEDINAYDKNNKQQQY
jgi:hypothetical protein